MAIDTSWVKVSNQPRPWEPHRGERVRGVYTAKEGSNHYVRDEDGDVWCVSEASAPGSEGWIHERFLGVAPGERVECYLNSDGNVELHVL